MMEWARDTLSDEDALYIRYCLDRKPVWLNPDFLSEEEYRELERYAAEQEGLLADLSPHITCHSDIRGGCFLTVSWPDQPMEMYRMEFPSAACFRLWRVLENGEEIPASGLPVPYDDLFRCLHESRLPVAMDQLLPTQTTIMNALQPSNKNNTPESLPLLGRQYPAIYAALLLASHNGLLLCAQHSGYICRNVIAKCLGVKTVSAGQMQALRKVRAASGDTAESILHASRLLLTHWQELPLVIRTLPELPARAIHKMFLDWEKWPVLKQCHWYAGWFQNSVFDSPLECLMYALLAMHVSGDKLILKRIKSDTQLVKLVFRALHRQIKDDPHLDEVCEEREQLQLPDAAPCWCIEHQIRTWLEDMDPSLSLICDEPISSLLDEYVEALLVCLMTPDLADISKQSGRLIHCEDLTFPESSLHPGCGFRQVRTHRELMSLAHEMGNCLGGQFKNAYWGALEYWVYRSAHTGEPVAISINPHQGRSTGFIEIGQFEGSRHRTPSATEHKALMDWLSLQGFFNARP